jgi:hypothetical protein
MHADVAIRECAEDRVGERMQRDVGVRMAGELAGVRNFHAAEPHMIAAFVERVDVIADAGADIGKRHGVAILAREVLRRGHLHVALLALEYRDPQAGPFDQRGIVGKILAALRGGAAMRVEQGRVAKACGVCTVRRAERLRVAATRLCSSTSFTVSVTASPGTAAPLFAAAAIARLTSACEVNGRAASCTSTMSGLACCSASSRP